MSLENNKENIKEIKEPAYWVGYTKDFGTGFWVDPVFSGEAWHEGVGEEWECEGRTESETWAKLRSVLGLY